MKTYYIFGRKITIEKVDDDGLPHTPKARRRMANKLDQAIVDWHRMNPEAPHNSVKIERVKWMRSLTKAELRDCREWVEEAFANYGSGDIL